MGRVLRDLAADRGVTLVIAGGATGADRMAESWAHHERIPLCVFPANWRFQGKAAGPMRNKAMLDFGRPDIVIAFPGGRGTQNMIEQATAAGIPVERISA